MKSHVRINGYTLLIAIAALVFFVITTGLVMSVWVPQNEGLNHAIFSWPDAMANYAFTKQFILNAELTYNTPINELVGNIVHPRSTNIIQNNIVPMSFLGLVLIYGAIGYFTGTSVILFLTPLITSISWFFFYGLIKRVVKKEAAFISTILAMSLAPVLYFTSLVMLHTMLFVSLLVIGFWFLTHHGFGVWESKSKNKLKLNSQYIFLAIGASIIGGALTVRTVEAPWVLASCLALLVLFKRAWHWKALIFVVFLSISFIPVLYMNAQTYGDPFTLGYLNFEKTGDTLDRLPTEFQVSGSSKVISTIKAVFVPFGVNIKALLKNTYKYFGEFFWPYLSLAAMGFLVFVFSKDKSRNQKAYITIAVISSLWLWFYYGNWVFDDADILQFNTIGSSYMRYWLPIFLMMLPGVGLLLTKVRKLPTNKWLNLIVVLLVVSGLSIYSYSWAFNTPRDGLNTLETNLNGYYDRYRTTSQLLPENAILIVDRTDKLFFPRQEVVVFLLDYNIFTELEKIVDSEPVYYLTVMPDTDINFINRVKINDHQLQFANPIIVDDQYRLFELQSINGGDEYEN